jgi:hypothetical protein
MMTTPLRSHSITDATPALVAESKKSRQFEYSFPEGFNLHYLARIFITLIGLTVATGVCPQETITRARGTGAGETGSSTPSPGSPATHDAMNRVIDGVKEAERAQYLYERVERVESRKLAGDANPQSVKVSRVVPAGTGIAKISLGPDGKPANEDAYRAELDKLLKSLTWAVESGQPQREAYQKVRKKQKERDDLIEATRGAFIFSYLGQETRGNRMLSKYRMEPNPAFKPTSRATSIFTRVKGFLWVDDATQQLARVEGEVTDDISLGLFLAKVYKGSRFMQDRYETAPGLWLPSFSQYDFDGRKFFSSFSVHEKTFYSRYKRIGSPAEAIEKIQAELATLNGTKAKPTEDR